MQKAIRVMLVIAALAAIFYTLFGCAGGALSTREKGTVAGGLLGAGTGAIIGGALGDPGKGAAIGGGLGLLGGFLTGGAIQGQEEKQKQTEYEVWKNQQELEKQRREIEELRKR